MAQVTFTDPKLGTVYTWLVNPPWDGVQMSQKQRQIERASNTGNVGATKQQGDDGPWIIHWEPIVFHESQELAFWEWYALSKRQTIILTDWNGDSYEGQIVTLGQQWVGVLGGTLGDVTARLGYSKWVFEFEVYRFISGAMATAAVDP